jgi:hypothetical protein
MYNLKLLEAVMVQYDLILIDNNTGTPLANPFPPESQPYGSFNSGDMYFLEQDNLYKIVAIAYTMAGQPGDVVCRTALYLSQFRKEDYPVAWPW